MIHLIPVLRKSYSIEKGLIRDVTSLVMDNLSVPGGIFGVFWNQKCLGFVFHI